MAGPVGPGSTQAQERCEHRARPFVRRSIREDHQGLRPWRRALRPDTRLQVPVTRQQTREPLATRGRSIHVVLLEQDRPDQAGDRGLVGEDADHLGAALDLAVDALQRIGRVDLGPVLLGEAHVGEHVLLGFIKQCGELGQLGPDLVGDLAPLGLGGVGMVLGEGGGDERRHHAPAALAGMGEGVAHEVHPAALPAGAEHAGDRSLDALMGIRDLIRAWPASSRADLRHRDAHPAIQ